MGTLYENGRIIATDAPAQAVLEEDGRVAAVGAREQMRALAGSDAQIVDLRGRTLAPAFIDAHSHFLAVAHSMLQADLSGVRGVEELFARIAAHIRDNHLAPGEYVLCGGFDPQDMGGYPSLAALDAMAPGYAVVIQHKSGHAGMLSTLALERAGVTAQTPDPDGGRIGREDGRLTGYMEENAFLQAQRTFPMPGMEELMQAARRAQTLYASCGIVLAQEGLMMRSMLPVYEELLRRGLLALDIVGYPSPQDYETFAQAFPRSVGRYDRHLRLGGIKIILDGSPQARTAYLSEPYANAQDGYRGYPSMTLEETVEAVMQASRLGVQILMHCNGDAAAQQMIDACGLAARRGADLARVRPVMIHAQMLRPDQMRALGALHIMPSFFAAHVYHWGDVHVENLGQTRASAISACASAQRLGLPFTLHQDAPVIRPDMLETLWIACARRTKAGRVLGEDERIDPRTALRAVTADAALQYGEKDRGAICPGMRADFVILSESPLDVEKEALRDIRVEETISAGRTIWRAGGEMDK